MGLFRLLVLIGLGWLVYRLLQKWRIEISPRDPRPPAERFEPMARCAGCGLYLPAQSLSPGQRCGACEKGRS
ncbi:MAG: hypothetical protein NVS9B10_29360 [Nevskia sp.]